MRIRKGTTPTLKLILKKKNESDPEIDLSIADDIFVTFSRTYQQVLFTKTGDDLEIDGNDIYVFLSQEETLSLKGVGNGSDDDSFLIMVNWTYTDDVTHRKKRASTVIKSIYLSPNLINEVV